MTPALLGAFVIAGDCGGAVGFVAWTSGTGVAQQQCVEDSSAPPVCRLDPSYGAGTYVLESCHAGAWVGLSWSALPCGGSGASAANCAASGWHVPEGWSVRCDWSGAPGLCVCTPR
jgi:hypothetical protein